MTENKTRINFADWTMTLHEGTVVPLRVVTNENEQPLGFDQLLTHIGKVNIVAGPAPDGHMVEFTIQFLPEQ